MDVKKKHVMYLASALCLSCCAFELKATPLADLLNRFSSLPPILGVLGDQIETIQQELAYFMRVEARDPWSFFTKEMSSSYPFFEEYAIGPIAIYFPKEISEEVLVLVFTKSQWWVEHCKILLVRFEKIKNLAEAEDLPTDSREELQNLLQEATAFIQAIHDENQPIHLEEQEAIKGRRAQINPEEYMASLPDDFKGVFIYLQNLERGISDPNVDMGEMLKRQTQFMDWQVRQSLIPFLPKEADREQFFKTSECFQAEAIEGL
jgi:hypothetical protein